MNFPIERIVADVDPSTHQPRFDIDISVEEGATPPRKALLTLIEHVSGLRRRLLNYTHTEMFTELEWKIDHFDISSQATHFWSNPEAATLATGAERARRITTPALQMSQELSALEDLAHEAYHARSFAIVDDLSERIAELEPQVYRLFQVILCSAFEQPDRIVFFLGSRKPHDPWRAQLIRWYAELAERRDLSFELWRSATESELQSVTDEALLTDPSLFYKKSGIGPSGHIDSASVFALVFDGFAARPFLMGEQGLHRLVSEDQNAVAEVHVAPEQSEWMAPAEVLRGASNPPTVRIWNTKSGEVSIPYFASVPFSEDDVWEDLAPILDEVAWMIVEARWY